MKNTAIKVLAAIALLLAPLSAGATYIPYQGGTGTSATPNYGDVLVGTGTGVYAPQATSTLNVGGTNYWSAAAGNIFNNTGDRVQFPTFDATSTTATSTINQSLSIGNASAAPLLTIGSTTPTYGYLVNDRLNIVDSRNDYSALNVYNLSSGKCATADVTQANDLNSTALNFFDMGHTSSGFTGSGCPNNPFTGFGPNSSYLFDPTGYMNFALGSTSDASFKWYTGGYAAANQKMVLTNGGTLGIGTTSPAVGAFDVNGDSYFNGSIGINVLPATGAVPSTLRIATTSSVANTTMIRADLTYTGSTGTNNGITINTTYTGAGDIPFTGLNSNVTYSSTVDCSQTSNNGGCARNRYVVTNGTTGHRLASMVGVTSKVQAGSAGTMSSTTLAIALNAETPGIGASNVIDTFAGVYVQGGTPVGTLTTRYGVYVDPLLGGATRYGFYQAGGNDMNYFNGLSGFGTSTPAFALSVSTSTQQDGTIPLFAVASTTNAIILTALGNGNVGIGTTSPSKPLSVGLGSDLLSSAYFVGNVGIGTQSTAKTLLFIATTTFQGAAGAGNGIIVQVTYNGSTANGRVSALNFQSNWSGTANSTASVQGGAAVGSLGLTNNGSIGLNAFMLSGTYARCDNTGAFASTTNCNGMFIGGGNNIANGLISTSTSLYIQGGLEGGTVTNRNGIYIEPLIEGTNRYGIYQAGSNDLNYFAGNFGIGTTTPGSALSIQGNVFLAGNITATSTATSTFASDISIAAGHCYQINGTCLTAGSIGGGFTQAVNWATAAVLAGTPTYSNGASGVGATLTEVGTGALSVDGGSPAANDRVLVKNQASSFQDGIYVVTATGSGIASYVLTRSSDYNSPTQITPGINTYVISGTANTDTTWAVTYTPPLVIGTNSLTYIESAGGSGSGTVTSVGLSDSNSSLTIGSTPVTTSGTITATLNLAHSNPWSALQIFALSSTTLASHTGTSWFGGTSTTTINADGLGTIAVANTTATSTLSHASATQMVIGSITGILTAVSGYVQQLTLSAGLSLSGTTLSQVEHRSFTYATSTAWTATTTIPLETGYGEVYNNVVCFTDVGTVNVDIYHSTNHLKLLNASTTQGTNTFPTNATITTGEKTYVDIGTPASSPTKINCTVKDTF